MPEAGHVPAQLQRLSALTTMNLDNNHLSGSIPSGSPAGLAELVLHGNSLTGGIPSGLGGLSALSKLFLQGNLLSGTVPSELGASSYEYCRLTNTQVGVRWV